MVKKEKSPFFSPKNSENFDDVEFEKFRKNSPGKDYKAIAA